MRVLVLDQPFSMALEYSDVGLASIKKRIDQLERFRITNAIQSGTYHFQHVFNLLPALIHFNYPDLIGYVENAPSGIASFELTKYVQDTLNIAVHHSVPCLAAFDGLYAMGSIGSITQTHYSDLDLWLCHSQEFNESEQKLIQQKLELIKQWAKTLEVELSFYLMNPNEFKEKRYSSEVTDDHNGSAQHFFLLDEFYRSAVRLSGKRILWLHLPNNDHKPYHIVIQQMIESHQLDLSEWIDFGDFSELSVNEYFGASLWQLYKGIESPYKSLIKILLLESYAETYPKTDLISQQFKRLLHENTKVVYHFDPYLAMLDQVTCYLRNYQQFHRLNCLRSCFYIKANDGQYDPRRHKELDFLIMEWGWNEKDAACLKHRPYWKIKQVMGQHNMLVEQLLQSYRQLIHFAHKYHIDPNIMPQDTDILMRKLYSVFEAVPGKIVLLNENCTMDLSEQAVTFIEVNESVSTQPGWYMMNHAPGKLYDSSLRYVQYHKNLIKLVAWAYFNGVLTTNTQMYLASKTLHLDKLRQFITDLRLSFPIKSPKVQREELYHPNEIRHLIVAVNLTKDPTETASSMKLESEFDLFNLGSSDEGVIGSVSIIYRNMWNEILTQHFEGDNAILKALKFISNKIYRNSASPESVNVFCYSVYWREKLCSLIKDLVNRCITVQIGKILQKDQIQTIRMDNRKWQLVFNQSRGLTEIIQATDNIDTVEVNSQKTYIPNGKIPKEISAFASEGFLQFFFEDNPDDSFNVYVLDKNNQAECYYYCTGSKLLKIREIGRIYAEAMTEANEYFGLFNFPQFYQLVTQHNQTFIAPFQIKKSFSK